MEENRTGAAAEMPLVKWRSDFSRVYQYYLDRSIPHTLRRWIGTLAMATIYALRIYSVGGFYVITYALGIYIVHIFIQFLSPKFKPETQARGEAVLPTRGSDEFKPFIRRLPEFKFWFSITNAFIIAFSMTFFSVLDVPVFWPMLLCYWIVLFVGSMKTQIRNMIKYKYIPFNIGKKRYGGGKKSGATTSCLADEWTVQNC